jgi:putative endonuclease
MSRTSGQYFVYIMTNKSGTLYVGVTNDLERRVQEHRNKLVKGFTAKYNIDRLVHFEVADEPRAAIAREKQIKGWLRAKKIALIESGNPRWLDLSADWKQGREILRGAQDDGGRRVRGTARVGGLSGIRHPERSEGSLFAVIAWVPGMEVPCRASAAAGLGVRTDSTQPSK